MSITDLSQRHAGKKKDELSAMNDMCIVVTYSKCHLVFQTKYKNYMPGEATVR